MPPLNQIQEVQARRAKGRPPLRKRMTTVTSDDIPASYKIEGLRLHEHPVVGLVVHPRIVPGFSYR